MLSSAAGRFVVVAPETQSPEYYWMGSRLNHVVEVKHTYNQDEGSFLKIKVYDPDNEQSAAYLEMRAFGIVVKKVRP